MIKLKKFLKSHSLLVGILLMFLLTWPIDLANAGLLPAKVPFPIYITLGYGFIYASIIMTGLTQGKDAVLSLLKRFLIWHVDWKWYLIALLLVPMIFTSAVLLEAILTQSRVDFSGVFAHQIFGASASLPYFVIPYLLFDALTNGEEIGWRGYVLPRLQAKYSALTSSLILGVIWGIWHLPKFLSPESTTPFSWFMVEIITRAVLYTWLYNNTRGSLLLTTIFHAAGNTAGVFLPLANTISGSGTIAFQIATLLEILIVSFVIAYSGLERLSRAQSPVIL